MKIFKKVMAVMCSPLGTFCFGYATVGLFTGNYKIAAWMLFITSIVFLVGYATERFGE